MKYVSFDDFFAVLGSQPRVKILQLLNKQGGQNVGQISQRLDREQSAISHDMKRLLECHFVEVEVAGKQRIYSINHDTVQPLFELIERHVSKYCAKGCKHWE